MMEIIHVKKYVHVRMPLKAYDNFIKKKAKMEDTAHELLGKPKIIPLTKVFTIISETPVTIDNEYLLGLVKKRRRKSNDSY